MEFTRKAFFCWDKAKSAQQQSTRQDHNKSTEEGSRFWSQVMPKGEMAFNIQLGMRRTLLSNIDGTHYLKIYIYDIM